MAATPPPKPRFSIGPYPSEVEVVVICTSDEALKGWLSSWKSHLTSSVIRAVCEDGVEAKGDSSSISQLEVTTRSALVKELGATASKLSLRDLAILSASKEYILFLDETCSPALNKAGEVSAIVGHLTNLTTPSTPFFFNTLYDPYAPGTDFVRGYPFSLRDGTPTAVSHGLWLNIPDYDAATQMAKSQERNTRFVDAVLTVPKGVAFSISTRNLAISKPLCGVAAFSGIDLDGNSSTDPTWASYCLKAVCDHLGYGCKTGTPYVSCDKPAVTAATVDMEKEYKGIKFQKEIYTFFTSLSLSKESTTPEATYLELAKKVQSELGPLDNYFKQLAEAMEAWVALYQKSAAVVV